MSSVHLFHTAHVLRRSSSTQTVIALSVGEAWVLRVLEGLLALDRIVQYHE